MNSTAAPKPRGEMRDRILAAAAEVFTAKGIKGATTREIATVAGVNEVSLFRHFKSKDLLLAGVFEQVISQVMHALYDDDQYQWTEDLRKDLTHYAHVYFANQLQSEPMMRLIIGEAKRQPDTAKMLKNLALPLRNRLADYFSKVKAQGKIRQEVDPLQAMDLFTGTLMCAVLRMSVMDMGYTAAEFQLTVVDIFVRGIENTTGKTA